MPDRPVPASASAVRPPARVRERKPTEKNLDALIARYLAAYTSATRAASEAAVDAVRDAGPLRVDRKGVEEAYLARLLPILDDLEPFVGDAVRLGATRIENVRGDAERLDRLVDAIVAEVRTKREAWLRKMAKDYGERVLARWISGLPRPDPGEARAAEDPVARPSDFRVGPVEKEFVFDEDLLDELLERGYRFGKVRAVEATQSDVWTGDDVGYVRAGREDGIDAFVWRVSPDDLVCPICRALEDEVYSGAEAEAAAFDRGDEAHCGCRCWLEAVEPED